uniref:RNA exonuclease 4 n=1 Tax=Glossina palpalis gambiensis TaxID=67801 RepID=A0A1B0BYU6_9MUSC
MKADVASAGIRKHKFKMEVRSFSGSTKDESNSRESRQHGKQLTANKTVTEEKRTIIMDSSLGTMKEVSDSNNTGHKKQNNIFTVNNANRKAAGCHWYAYLTNQSYESNGVVNLENNPMPSLSQRQKRKTAQQNKYVAMDCEMVGVGYKGQEDMLARVSIVNKRGEVLLDKFVKPCEMVTDYRTSISGIRPHNIENGDDFHDVQDQVKKLIQGKILVGHGIAKDLGVLQIKHPYPLIRDTARYKPLCRLVANGRTPSLKCITHAILGLDIQSGEHNSIEDARAAMKIYNKLSFDWENHFRKQKNHT